MTADVPTELTCPLGDIFDREDNPHRPALLHPSNTPPSPAFYGHEVRAVRQRCWRFLLLAADPGADIALPIIGTVKNDAEC